MTAVADSGVPAADATAANPGAGPRLSSILLFAFAAAGALHGLAPLSDNSYMWHVRTGRYMFDHGLPRGDLYSFTEPGIPWVLQSWLAELLYGVADRIGGGLGLRLLSAVVGGLVGGLLFWIARRGTHDRIRAALIAGAAFAAMLNVWSPRPLMFGILAMFVVVITVEFPDTPLGRHPYVTLPVSMWCWINVHGSWVVGFAYLALHLIGRALEGAPPNRQCERVLLRASLLSAAVVFVNPYFVDLVLFPFRLMARREVLADVAEWQSPNFREVDGLLFGVWLLIAVALFLVARRDNRPRRRDLLIAVVFALFGLYATRNIGLTLVAMLPIVARAAAPRDPGPDPRRPAHRIFVAAGTALVALAVVSASGTAHWNLKTYPVAAWKDVREVQHLEGRRLLTTDAWAGYVILRSWPDQKVFFDDRYDMYSLRLNDEFDDLVYVRENWRSVLDEHKIDLVMWLPQHPLSQALAKTGTWQETYRDDTAVVFVRKP